MFSDSLRMKIEHYLQRYETRRSAILPILHAIQDECGWIQEGHMLALEKDYDLPRVQVQEVATFYSMYRLEKPKKYSILFCDNIVCTMMGAKEAMEKIRHIIKSYEREGRECPFSLEGVPCLGVCDGAPALLLNKERHLRVGEAQVEALLQQYDKLPS